jgi:hypothetical protein
MRSQHHQAEAVPRIRAFVVFAGSAADVFDNLIVLDVEPLLEDLQAPVLRPHVSVRVPALQFPAEDFLADLLQNLVGVCI